MKVRVRENQSTSESVVHGSLKLGVEYVVLEILAPKKRGPSYRLVSALLEDSAIFDAELFDVIDSRLSAHWKAFALGEGGIQMTLDIWCSHGFWEKFYDGEASAETLYREGVALILGEDSLPA